MSSDNTINLAQKIAEQVIDQTYWGNEWFFFFTLLVIGLTCAFVTWGVTYLSTRAQNSAMRTDFEAKLKDLEKQTNSLKEIEESIAHQFLEKREQLRIKREKIEEIYASAALEIEVLGKNFSIVIADAMRDTTFPTHTTEMLIALYFKGSMDKELAFYREQRKALLTRIRELTEENLSGKANVGKERIEANQHFLKNYIQSVTNIHIALENEMKNLTRIKSTPTAGRS